MIVRGLMMADPDRSPFRQWALGDQWMMMADPDRSPFRQLSLGDQ